MPLRVQVPGHAVRHRHHHRQHVHPHPPDMQQPVRRAQVVQKPERAPLQRRQVGQERVRRQKERYLHQNRERRAQRVNRLVALLPVVRAQHHEPLVPPERLPDPPHLRRHRHLLVPFHPLPALGYHVDRQRQERHRKRQPYRRYAVVVDNTVKNRVDDFNGFRDGENTQPIQDMSNHTLSFLAAGIPRKNPTPRCGEV